MSQPYPKQRLAHPGAGFKDPGGNYLLRSRMYDPSTARFVLPDPIGFLAGDANLYRYCHNDPVNHTDPNGQIPDWLVNTAKKVLKRLGIDVDKFERDITEKCGTINILDYLDVSARQLFSLVADPGSLLDSVGGGVLDAANEIQSNAQALLTEGLEGWLMLPGITNFAANPDPQQILPIVLDALGLTWEHVLNTIKNSTGIDPASLIYAFNRIESSLESDVGVALNNWRTMWLNEDREFQEEFERALREARVAIIETLIKEVGELIITKVVKELAAAAASFGFGTVLTTLVDLAGAVSMNAGRICDLIRSVFEGIRGVLTGDNRQAVKTRLLAAFRMALPILYAAVAQKFGFGRAPEAIRGAIRTAGEKARKPLDTILAHIGPYFKRITDRVYAADQLIGPLRPLSTPKAKEYPQEGYGRLTLWEAERDKQVYLRASPAQKASDYIDSIINDQGTSSTTRSCLQRVKTTELPAVLSNGKQLDDVLKKREMTKTDVRSLSRLNHQYVVSEEALLDAIVGCIKSERDPCSLHGLTMTVSADPTALAGAYSSSASFSYLPSVQIYNPRNERVGYRPVSSVVALVGGNPPTSTPNSRDSRNYERWTLYWPCRIHEPFYRDDRNNSRSDRTRPSPCNPMVSAEGHAAYWDEMPVNPNCPKCEYFSHPTIGWPGNTAPPRAQHAANSPVEYRYCQIPRAGERSRDDVGHIIAKKWGGRANLDDPNPNLFPQNGDVNQGDFNTYENAIVRAVESAPAPRRLCIRIVFKYTATGNYPNRPTGFDYYYWINNRRPSNAADARWPRTFRNPAE